MATHQWRLPAGTRAPLRIPLPGEATVSAGRFSENSGKGVVGDADLLSALPGTGEVKSHPNFEARAAIWRDHSAGLISFAEAKRRSENVGRAAVEREKRQRVASCPREARPAPAASRQYAPAMSTTAARDDRLTPQAKSLLTVLRARCGKNGETDTTKGTLAATISRSTRSVMRYLRGLELHGYIKVETRQKASGLHTGLTIQILEPVRTFYETAKGLAEWLAETPAALFRPFEATFDPVRARATNPSPKNQSINNLSSFKRNPLSKRPGSGLERTG